MSTLTGHCLCGAVRFEITEPLVSARYCHCTRCQRRTGTASSAGAFTAPGSFRLVQGAERVVDYVPPDGFVKAFCGICGSALYSRDRDDTALEHVAVRLGSIDGDPGIRPQARQFVAYAAPWEPIPGDGLPRYEERQPRD